MSTRDFSIKRNWALHESGTKYYQIFTIVESGHTTGVVLTHHGKHVAGSSRNPLRHGRASIVHAGSGSLTHAESVRRAKAKRGYGPWEPSEEFFSDGDLEHALRVIFSTKDSSAILSFLYGDWGVLDDVAPGEGFIVQEPSRSIEPIIDASRGKNWGSW